VCGLSPPPRGHGARTVGRRSGNRAPRTLMHRPEPPASRPAPSTAPCQPSGTTCATPPSIGNWYGVCTQPGRQRLTRQG
jgi:hypothetical protein